MPKLQNIPSSFNYFKVINKDIKIFFVTSVQLSTTYYAQTHIICVKIDKQLPLRM